MSQNEKEIESLMLVLGAAGGALALEALSQRVSMRKDALAAVGAGVAYLAATNATGPVRELAMGAAAASACYAVVETLRTTRPKMIYGAMKPVELPQRQAAADGVSQAQFQKAMDDMAKKQEMHIVEIRRQADEAIATLRHAYETRIAELQATVHSLLQQLRDASAERIVARNARRRRIEPVASPAPVIRDEQPANENSADESDSVAASKPAVETSDVEDKATAKMKAIYAQLTDDEIERLREILTSLPPATIAAAQAQLLAMSTNEAVAYLRDNVLPRQAA